VIKNVAGSIITFVVPATIKGNVSITNLPKNSESVDTRANNNTFTREDIISAKQDSNKKLMVVCQPPTEDTSIETRNETSGEVAVDMVCAQIDDKLITSFPNVNIAFRIYLSIFGTSAEGERSFSRMKLINYLRSTMGQQQLSSLLLLSIENDVMRQLPFGEIISEFAHKKCRKVNI
jgi:hypothetical protein